MSDYAYEVHTFHESLDYLKEHLGGTYSQWGEESVLKEIFRRIGTNNRYCFECGAANGVLFSNSRAFIEDGWRATLIEANHSLYAECATLYRDNHKVRVHHAFIQPTGANTVDHFLEADGAPEDIDLFVVDIDSTDFYIWQSLLKFRPRVVMIEYDPSAEPDSLPPYGAGQPGWRAYGALAARGDYIPVLRTYCNLIFVRADCVSGLVPDGGTLVRSSRDTYRKVSVSMAMTVPRLGWQDNFGCLAAAISQFNMPLHLAYGAFFGQGLTRAMRDALENDKPDYLLTSDYDSIYRAQDVAKLVCLMEDNPDIGALAAMQVKRDGSGILAESDGSVDLSQPLVPIKSAHFGLTIFRASIFEKLEKPWFYAKPNDEGDWGEGRLDEDIAFWYRLRDAGIKAMMSTEVRIGHLQATLIWPTSNGGILWQHLSQYREGANSPPSIEQITGGQEDASTVHADQRIPDEQGQASKGSQADSGGNLQQGAPKQSSNERLREEAREEEVW